jgi:hypothetical protein
MKLTLRISPLALLAMTGVTAHELVRTVRESVIVRLFHVCFETSYRCAKNGSILSNNHLVPALRYASFDFLRLPFASFPKR